MENNILPEFSKFEIEKATSVLYKYGDDRACSNNRIFGKGIKATYNDDYSYMSLKRTRLEECKVIKSNFTAAAVTGSRFIQTSFIDCKISGANFQSCDFVGSSFQDFSHEIETSNFSNSVFTDTEFKKVNFHMNTIFQSLFENCVFANSIIKATTLEGSIFRGCVFNNVNMSNLNIDYVTLHNPSMNNVVLPFFQAPYIINGFLYLSSTKDDVWIDSEKSPKGRISVNEYMQNAENLIIYFWGLKEFFPLANIYLSLNNPKSALACIKEGTERACRQNDFRKIKHFCRLVTSTPQFKTEDMRQIYDLLNKRFDPKVMKPRELHNYLQNIGEIRTILLNGSYNLQTLEIIIQTNINAGEVERLNALLRTLNSILDEFGENNRSQVVELRHNSPYAIFISCVDTLADLMPVLLSLYSAFGVIDKVAKFRSTLLDIKVKRNTLKKTEKESAEIDAKQTSSQATIQRDNDYIELLKKQVKSLESDKRRINKEKKELRTCVLELTHYIKGTEIKFIDTDIQFSKTKFDKPEEN